MLLSSVFVRAEDQPNVLWIYVEDLSPWMNLYGDYDNPTPTMEKLAESGVLFKNTFNILTVSIVKMRRPTTEKS